MPVSKYYERDARSRWRTSHRGEASRVESNATKNVRANISLAFRQRSFTLSARERDSERVETSCFAYRTGECSRTFPTRCENRRNRFSGHVVPPWYDFEALATIGRGTNGFLEKDLGSIVHQSTILRDTGVGTYLSFKNIYKFPVSLLLRFRRIFDRSIRQVHPTGVFVDLFSFSILSRVRNSTFPFFSSPPEKLFRRGISISVRAAGHLWKEIE